MQKFWFEKSLARYPRDPCRKRPCLDKPCGPRNRGLRRLAPKIELREDWPPKDRPSKPTAPSHLSRTTVLPLYVPPCWRFQKNDPDPWPSLLHGHHSWKPLKLDAITGFPFPTPKGHGRPRQTL
jgi:hypothetical protein